MTERWLPVIGWEGLYEVSDLGRVRSLPRRTARGVRGGRVLKPHVGPGTRGYPQVSLSVRHETTHKFVHHLVLEAHDRPRPPGLEARHGSGGKLDARLVNLCWGTRKENIADRVRDGQDSRGERNGQTKLTLQQVIEIRARAASGERQCALATEYQVCKQTISLVVRRLHWTWVP